MGISELFNKGKEKISDGINTAKDKYKEYSDFKAWQREQRKRKPAEEYSVDITMRGKDRYHRKHK